MMDVKEQTNNKNLPMPFFRDARYSWVNFAKLIPDAECISIIRVGRKVVSISAEI